MKTIDAGLLATYRSQGPTIAVYVIVKRKDTHTFRWIGHDEDRLVLGELFKAAPGVQISSLVSSEGFAVDNAEITIHEDDDITRADILAGLWDGAEIEFGEIDWNAAIPVPNILKKGTLGNITPMRGYSVVEFRDLRQAIQTNYETVMQPTCRYSFGNSKCTVNLASYTVSGTIDSHASQYSVYDAARTEAADWFGEGIFTFTSGPNAGISQKVKSFTAGTFVFWNQFVHTIGLDSYTVSAGCRLRFQEDCISKFSNGINFGGEPNKANPDLLSAPP